MDMRGINRESRHRMYDRRLNALVDWRLSKIKLIEKKKSIIRRVLRL